MAGAGAVGVGACAGFAGSLVGLGGGFIAIPMMTNFLKMTQHQAHATSLAVVAMTGTTGGIAYSYHGYVDTQAALAIAAAGIVTVPYGAACAGAMKGRQLKIAMGMMQLGVAPLVPLRDTIMSARREGSLSDTQRTCLMGVIGGATGFLSGMFGVGGGALIVPALGYLGGMNQRECVATSLASMALPSLLGCVSHYRRKTLVPRVAFPMMVGSVVGTAAASQIVHHLPEEHLRYLFSLYMVVLGVRALRA